MAKRGGKGMAGCYNSGGSGTKSSPQRPVPGPQGSGPPPAMRKALAKKSMPDKGRSFPGSVR